MNVFHMLFTCEKLATAVVRRGRLIGVECGCISLEQPPSSRQERPRRVLPMYIHTDRYRREIIQSEGFLYVIVSLE